MQVWDKKLQELVSQAVQKNSIIRLTGRLVVNNDVDNEKRKRSAVHIHATNIWTRASNQQNAEKLAAVWWWSSYKRNENIKIQDMKEISSRMRKLEQ